MPKKQYTSHYEHLKNKWLDNQKQLQKSLTERHKDAFEWLQHTTKNVVLTSMSGLILLSHPAVPSIFAAQPQAHQEIQVIHYTKDTLIHDLGVVLPTTVQPLSEDQEKIIGQTLTRHFKIPVTATLQEKKLNRSYGLIGAEQHLMRYPGDVMDTHFSNQEDAEKFYSSGMAPGRGAWGYFAPSQGEMTEKDIQREKYYIAVQTFLSPGFTENVNELYNFFKYRKMIVVNPENGKALIADIGDAGPSPWTGKHLGGSPEVMNYLERVDGAQKGPVLYFFVDDPDDTIPLGPIQIQ